MVLAQRTASILQRIAIIEITGFTGMQSNRQ